MLRTPQRLQAGPQLLGDDIVHRNLYELNGLSKHVLVGSILGDGNLTPASKRRGEAQLHLGYSDKTLAYLEWIHFLLQEIGVHEIKQKAGYNQHHFYTHPSKLIGQFRLLFYPQGEKRVPENIKDLLVHPIALAIWYQDDGTLDARDKYHWNARIATYCFPKQDCARLVEVLKQNFGLDVGVARCTMRNKEYWQLYFRSNTMPRFIELIKPYIHRNFQYKIRQVGQQQR